MVVFALDRGRGAARALGEHVALVAQLGLAAQQRHPLRSAQLLRLQSRRDGLQLAEDLDARGDVGHLYSLDVARHRDGRTLAGMAEGEQETLAALGDLLVL